MFVTPRLCERPRSKRPQTRPRRKAAACLIADHSAKAGDGTSVGKTFYPIEEGVLRKEVEAAGFKLVADGNFLRHPEDTRDVIVFRAPTPIDEFVLKYQKPQ
jgi:predicted methyltransferase